MTRSHRLAHRAIWLVLAFAVALGFTCALALRHPKGAEVLVQAAASAR
jgi:hypothetical protein